MTADAPAAAWPWRVGGQCDDRLCSAPATWVGSHCNNNRGEYVSVIGRCCNNRGEYVSVVGSRCNNRGEYVSVVGSCCNNRGEYVSVVGSHCNNRVSTSVW